MELASYIRVCFLCFCLTATIGAKAATTKEYDPSQDIPECRLSGDPEKDKELLSGDYLSKIYVENLIKTHSLSMALDAAFSIPKTPSPNDDNFILMTITKKDGGKGFGISFAPGWHESTGEIDTENYALVEKELKDREIKIIDKCHTNTYVFVKDNYAFITSVLLTGKYVDDKGERYEFTQDGKVIFPHRTLYYQLMLDTVGQPDGTEFIEVGKTPEETHRSDAEKPQFIALRRKGNDIILYPTRPPKDDSEVILYAIAYYHKPIARIHKIQE